MLDIEDKKYCLSMPPSSITTYSNNSNSNININSSSSSNLCSDHNDNIIFFIETLPNVHVAHVSIQLPLSSCRMSLHRIHVKLSSIMTTLKPRVVSSTSTRHHYNIPLPYVTDPLKAIVTDVVQGESILLRVPILPQLTDHVWKRDDRSKRSLACEAMGSAISLMKHAGTRLVLSCRCCGHSLAGEGVGKSFFNRILALPSDGWMDLLDCWVCHKEDYEEYHHGRRDFAARFGVCFVADAFCLVHGSAINKSSLRPPRNSVQQCNTSLQDTDNWLEVQCGRCRSIVGSGKLQIKSKNIIDAAMTWEAVRLFKHLTCATKVTDVPSSNDDKFMHTEIKDFFRNYSLETYISSLLAFKAQRTSSYRFVVSAGQLDCSEHYDHRREYYARLWIVSWDCEVLSNSVEGSHNLLSRFGLQEHSTYSVQGKLHHCDEIDSPQLESSDFIPSLKVLYEDSFGNSPMKKDDVDADNTTDFRRRCRNWIDDPKVELIEMTVEKCFELILLLRASSLQLPPSKRILQGFRVGFLRRTLLQ